MTSRRVLASDLLRGRHLPDSLASAPSQDQRDRDGQLPLNPSCRREYAAAMCYAEPRSGHCLFMPGESLGLLEFGCVRLLRRADAEDVLLAGRALRNGAATREKLIARSVAFDDIPELAEDHQRLIGELCDWIWEPLRQRGTFDFGVCAMLYHLGTRADRHALEERE